MTELSTNSHLILLKLFVIVFFSLQLSYCLCQLSGLSYWCKAVSKNRPPSTATVHAALFSSDGRTYNSRGGSFGCWWGCRSLCWWLSCGSLGWWLRCGSIGWRLCRAQVTGRVPAVCADSGLDPVDLIWYSCTDKYMKIKHAWVMRCNLKIHSSQITTKNLQYTRVLACRATFTPWCYSNELVLVCIGTWHDERSTYSWFIYIRPHNKHEQNGTVCIESVTYHCPLGKHPFLVEKCKSWNRALNTADISDYTPGPR